jgi:hypothetical protein
MALYWEIGRLIAEKQAASGWGDAVIDQIARDLTRELGGIQGLSRANLYRMKRFIWVLCRSGSKCRTTCATTSVGAQKRVVCGSKPKLLWAATVKPLR